MMAADPIHQRICKELGKICRSPARMSWPLMPAKGLINQEEASILTRAETSRLRSINVDDFAADELATKPVKLPEKSARLKRHNKSNTAHHDEGGNFPPFVTPRQSSIFNKIFHAASRC